MLELKALSKTYGSKAAVDSLTFTLEPGVVTGFLGPNGSGKSTTMRMIAGLDRPSAGSVLVNGVDYRGSPAPLGELGILLEAKAVHTGRSARNHLLAMAASNSIRKARVDEVIDMVGLREVAKKRVGTFSLGMGQRLGIAQALLGDPRTVLLDEPINGLDPQGVLWVRNLLKHLAGEGRTVFVSSHLMSEMAVTAERLIVVGRGKLLADTTVTDLMATNTGQVVNVRSPQAAELQALLTGPAVSVTSSGPGWLRVSGLTSEQIGDLAWNNGIRLHELATQQGTLEEAFMAMTDDSVEYASGPVA